MRNLQMQIPICSNHDFGEGLPLPTAKVRAFTILSEFDQAQTELVGKAGTVERVWLDETHGLRISIRGHDGKWPVSTIKLAEGY